MAVNLNSVTLWTICPTTQTLEQVSFDNITKAGDSADLICQECGNPVITLFAGDKQGNYPGGWISKGKSAAHINNGKNG